MGCPQLIQNQAIAAQGVHPPSGISQGDGKGAAGSARGTCDECGPHWDPFRCSFG